MKYNQTQDEIIGRRITSPVYSANGHLLLARGTVVNYNILSKLEQYAIDPDSLFETLSDGITPKGIISNEQMEKSVSAVKTVFENVLHHDPNGVSSAIPYDHMELVENVVQSLIEALENAEDLLYTVAEMAEITFYTYKHSVNVAILSILTARAMNYSKEDIRNIALGAFLHDIGKMCNDQSIINKAGQLTQSERKEIEKHPQLGYNLVKAIQPLPFTAKNIILMHHEKLDGSGYPLGLKGIEIPEYVRIVTVCDMYDAMTADRVYRGKMPIYTALEILMTDAVFKLDRKVYRYMTENICIYPPGSGVILSDGRVGIVSFYRASNPSRPHVRVIDIENDIIDMKVIDINLEKVQTLFVIDTWDVTEFRKTFKPKFKPQSPLAKQIKESESKLKEVV